MTEDLFPIPSQPTPRPATKRPPTSPKRRKKAAPRNKGVKRNTSVSRLLENAALSLKMAGFVIYDNFAQFRFAQDRNSLPQRYLVEHFPHPALYEGKGFKEGYISDNGTEYIFEAKWQNTSGSVDEKIPYLWEHFLISDVPNWIVWFDGNYWRDGRGRKAVNWLCERIRTRCPEGRQFLVLRGSKHGQEFFSNQFGQRAP
jgi:hypothetical protein